MKHTAFLLAALGAGSSSALELEVPVQCELGRDCYIQSYVDRDPGPGSSDFTCGGLTYDGHKGTDFRLPNLSDLNADVAVLAAADGVVRAIRDGEPDLGLDHFREGRDCGNAVVITHGDGWETQYCHLANGSVRVKAGDLVQAGEQLGTIGYSGRTEFPHLHLSVRQDGVPVDPFDARPASADCRLEDQSTMWSATASEALNYQPGGIVDGGFAPGAVKLDNIRAGTVALWQEDSPALVFWTRFYGLSPQDELTLRILGPDGALLSETAAVMPRARAEHMIFSGRKKPDSGWPKGIYRAKAAIIRDGGIYREITETIQIP